MHEANISEAKRTISSLILQEPGVCAVGTGIDEQGRAVVVIHLDPNMADARARVAKLVEPYAAQVPIQYIESGPYRKLPAT